MPENNRYGGASKTPKDAEISIVGINDPAVDDGVYDARQSIKERLTQSIAGSTERNYRILLAHRPEYIKTYASAGVDLVLAGHAHGGQVRLPFIGGLIAPGQGVFPKYSAGAYKMAGTTMMLSRGLGNSVIRQRLFNRPEVVLITLENR